MGLLEKALSFKKNLNKKGKKTLIDQIPGPAETEILSNDKEEDVEVLFLQPKDLEIVEVFPEFEENVKVEKPSPVKPAKKEDKKIIPEDNQDLVILSEIGNDILIADSVEELYDVILFSIMGQIGVSSSIILLPSEEDENIWKIVDFRGVDIDDPEIFFDSAEGILASVVNKKEIIDVEDFKKDKNLTDDYLKFISIDTRLLVPILSDEEIIGMIALGEKIMSEEFFSDEDKNFLKSICEYVAIALKKITSGPNEETSIDLQYINDIDRIQKQIRTSSSIDNVGNIIQREFKILGIESFAFFATNIEKNRFLPIITEREDYLKLQLEGFSINRDNNFINFISSDESLIVIDNLSKSPIMKYAFHANLIKELSSIRIFPFKISGVLQGFISIFRISNGADFHEIDVKMLRLSSIIFEYLESIVNLDQNRNKYVDNIEHVFSKIEDEISNAKKLNIPLSILLFSIKNYKRYFHLMAMMK